MAAGRYNLIIDAGASFYRSITYEDSAGASPDLSSGYTASMKFADNWGEAPTVELTESSGITLGAAGSIIINAKAEIASLPVGDGVYTLEITKTATGYVDQILRGKINVRAKVGT